MDKSMRKERTSLTRSAMASARARDHTMSSVTWKHKQSRELPIGFGTWHGYAKCLSCGRQLKLETHPAPNSIAISGEAVSRGCVPPH